MTYKELIKKLTPGSIVRIKGIPYRIKQHIVWMQHRANYSYDKWVLVDNKGCDDYRMFIEESESTIGFAKIFRHDFIEPMPDELEYDGKKYVKTWDEFCTAIKVEGEEVYREGENEIWWDYALKADEKRGLSLGRSWETWEREDLETEFLELEDVEI